MSKGVSKLQARFGKYGFLLASLLFLLVVQPFFKGLGLRVITQIATTGIFFSALNSVHDSKQQFTRSLALLIPALVLGWLRIPLGAPNLATVADLLMVLFFIYTAGCVLRQILIEKDVTVDTIYGSASVYLLAGLAFAFVFAAIEAVTPGSLSVTPPLEAAPGPGYDPLSEIVYFSFVTLTTLGYGDVTPQTPLTQSLAAFEAMVGQFYIAVLVARLVGLNLARPASRSSSTQ